MAHLSRQEMLTRFNQHRAPQGTPERARPERVELRTPQPDRRVDIARDLSHPAQTPIRDEGKYRSAATARKSRATFVARRAELQSELTDLHGALEHLHGDEGQAEAAFQHSQAMVEDIGVARLAMKDVDEQIAAVDEWIARDAAKHSIEEEQCVECVRCAQLVPRLLRLEEEAARRAQAAAEHFEELDLTQHRVEQQVSVGVEDLAALGAAVQREVAAAAAERRAWADEERARHETAAEGRADLLGQLPELLTKLQELQQRTQQREEEFCALRSEYRAVADLSLKMFHLVEEDRGTVASMAPEVREAGTVVRDSSTRLKVVEEAKEQIAEKLLRTEERLKVAESAQIENLGPKIKELEGKLAQVQEEEQELQKVVERNNIRLHKMETKCGAVSEWMRGLANPKGGALDMSDGSDAGSGPDAEGGTPAGSQA